MRRQEGGRDIRREKEASKDQRRSPDRVTTRGERSMKTPAGRRKDRESQR